MTDSTHEQDINQSNVMYSDRVSQGQICVLVSVFVRDRCGFCLANNRVQPHKINKRFRDSLRYLTINIIYIYISFCLIANEVISSFNVFIVRYSASKGSSVN